MAKKKADCRNSELRKVGKIAAHMVKIMRSPAAADCMAAMQDKKRHGERVKNIVQTRTKSMSIQSKAGAFYGGSSKNRYYAGLFGDMTRQKHNPASPDDEFNARELLTAAFRKQILKMDKALFLLAMKDASDIMNSETPYQAAVNTALNLEIMATYAEVAAHEAPVIKEEIDIKTMEEAENKRVIAELREKLAATEARNQVLRQKIKAQKAVSRIGRIKQFIGLRA